MEMIQIHPEYIFDEEFRKKAVIIPSAEWDIIVSEMEELDDIRAYDAAKEEDSIPFEQAVNEIKSGIVK